MPNSEANANSKILSIVHFGPLINYEVAQKYQHPLWLYQASKLEVILLNLREALWRQQVRLLPRLLPYTAAELPWHELSGQ